MKNIPALNDAQRKLVQDNISVVGAAIRSAITVNERIYGFEYADIFQEGCIWLCKAAVTYKEGLNSKFSTYATTVVTNGLLTYCRLMCNKQKKLITLPDLSDNEKEMSLNSFSCPDPIVNLISDIDTVELLHSLKKQYSGITRKGIEALELKTKGYTGTEIAILYGVKPNLVGAWISRALRKIENNDMFIVWKDNLIPQKKIS